MSTNSRFNIIQIRQNNNQSKNQNQPAQSIFVDNALFDWTNALQFKASFDQDQKVITDLKDKQFIHSAESKFDSSKINFTFKCTKPGKLNLDKDSDYEYSIDEIVDMKDGLIQDITFEPHIRDEEFGLLLVLKFKSNTAVTNKYDEMTVFECHIYDFDTLVYVLRMFNLYYTCFKTWVHESTAPQYMNVIPYTFFQKIHIFEYLHCILGVKPNPVISYLNLGPTNLRKLRIELSTCINVNININDTDRISFAHVLENGNQVTLIKLKGIDNHYTIIKRSSSRSARVVSKLAIFNSSPNFDL
jgi:hypothetical protein